MSRSTRSFVQRGVMTSRDRERYHQFHPAKLLVDWGAAMVAGDLLWGRRPVSAVAAGFGPSILVTLAFLSGRLDHRLEAIRNRPAARAIAPELAAEVNTLRFAGLAVSWAGCRSHQPWLLPAGVFVIVSAWWLAWRRGVRLRPLSRRRWTGRHAPGDSETDAFHSRW